MPDFMGRVDRQELKENKLYVETCKQAISSHSNNNQALEFWTKKLASANAEYRKNLRIFCFCRVSDLCKNKHMSFADLGRAVNIHPAVFSDWKKGRSMPKEDKIKRIANYFNVRTEYLLGLDDEATTEDYLEYLAFRAHTDSNTKRLAQRDIYKLRLIPFISTLVSEINTQHDYRFQYPDGLEFSIYDDDYVDRYHLSAIRFGDFSAAIAAITKTLLLQYAKQYDRYPRRPEQYESYTEETLEETECFESNTEMEGDNHGLHSEEG